MDLDVDVDVDVLQVDFLTRPTSLLSTRLRCRVGFAAWRKTIRHLKTSEYLAMMCYTTYMSILFKILINLSCFVVLFSAFLMRIY